MSLTIVAKAGPFVRVKEAVAASKRVITPSSASVSSRKWGRGRLSLDWDWGGLALDPSFPLSFLQQLQFGLWLQ